MDLANVEQAAWAAAATCFLLSSRFVQERVGAWLVGWMRDRGLGKMGHLSFLGMASREAEFAYQLAQVELRGKRWTGPRRFMVRGDLLPEHLRTPKAEPFTIEARKRIVLWWLDGLEEDLFRRVEDGACWQYPKGGAYWNEWRPLWLQARAVRDERVVAERARQTLLRPMEGPGQGTPALLLLRGSEQPGKE